MRIGVEGFGDTFRALDNLGAVGRKEASVAVAEATLKVHGDVLRMIQRGAKSGVVYKRGPDQNLSPTHRASAPGEAPATDSGGYVSSIDKQSFGLKGEVFSRMPRAFWLEYGTMKMSERPHFRPALEANREYFERRIAKALQRATQEFSKK